MIPKTTTPLTKFIRTTEGWLVVGSTGFLVILGAVGDMSWTKSGTAAAVLAGVTTASRSILKAVASLSPMTGDPITPAGFDPSEVEIQYGGIHAENPTVAGAPGEQPQQMRT